MPAAGPRMLPPSPSALPGCRSRSLRAASGRRDGFAVGKHTPDSAQCWVYGGHGSRKLDSKRGLGAAHVDSAVVLVLQPHADQLQVHRARHLIRVAVVLCSSTRSRVRPGGDSNPRATVPVYRLGSIRTWGRPRARSPPSRQWPWTCWRGLSPTQAPQLFRAVRTRQNSGQL